MFIAGSAIAGNLDPVENVAVSNLSMIFALVLGGLLAIAGLIIRKHERMLRLGVQSSEKAHKRYHYVCYGMGALFALIGVAGALYYLSDSYMVVAGVIIFGVGIIFLIAGRTISKQTKLLAVKT
jgi:hypothetical protein